MVAEKSACISFVISLLWSLASIIFISIGLLQFGPVRVYKKHSVEMFSSASEICLPKITPKIPKNPASNQPGHYRVLLFWSGESVKQQGTERRKRNIYLVWWLKFIEGADIWALNSNCSCFHAVIAETMGIRVWICAFKSVRLFLYCMSHRLGIWIVFLSQKWISSI